MRARAPAAAAAAAVDIDAMTSLAAQDTDDVVEVLV